MQLRNKQHSLPSKSDLHFGLATDKQSLALYTWYFKRCLRVFHNAIFWYPQHCSVPIAIQNFDWLYLLWIPFKDCTVVMLLTSLLLAYLLWSVVRNRPTLIIAHQLCKSISSPSLFSSSDFQGSGSRASWQWIICLRSTGSYDPRSDYSFYHLCVSVFQTHVSHQCVNNKAVKWAYPIHKK